MAGKNEQGARNFQIVFLVDVFLKEQHICENGLEEICNLKSRAISLCVLRLLLHFNSNINALKWGFKFYNSNVLNFEYKRRRFYELDSQSFEQFEREMKLRFTNACDSQNISTEDSTSAKSLSWSVTEVLHDFPWVTPDISSPSRSAKNELLNNQGKTSRNFLFVIGDCPLSGVDLSLFLGRNDSVCDAEVVLNEIFSTALCEEFRNTCGLSLFWIDSGLWCIAPKKLEAVVEDWGGHAIISSVAKKLGGNMIPISSLVQRTICPLTLENNSLSPKVFKQKAETLAELRVMAATFRFSFGQIVEAFLSGEDVVSLNVINDVKLIRKRCGLLQGNLYFQEKKVCLIVLHQILHKTLNTSDSSAECNYKIQTPKPGVKDDYREEIVPEDNSSAATAQQTGTDSGPKPDNEIPNCSKSTDGNTQPKQQSWDNSFVIKGVISSTDISPSWMHPTRLYSCFSGEPLTSTTTTEDKSTAELASHAGLFQQMLSLVSSKSCSVVVEYQDPESGSLVTGLLQPMTSLCAVLSMVRKEMLLLVEKALLRHQSRGYMLIPCDDSQMLPFDLRETGEDCVNDEETSKAGVFDNSSRMNEGKGKEKKFVDSYISGFQKNRSKGQESVKDLREKLKDYYSRKKSDSNNEKSAFPVPVLARGKMCQNASQKIKVSTSESQMNMCDSAMETEDSTTISNLDSEQTDTIDEDLSDTTAIQSIEDLKTTLEDGYKRCIEQEQLLTVYVTRVFRFIEHLKRSGELKDNCEIDTLLKSTVLRDVTSPRENSDGEESEATNEKIVLDYKLQVFIRLEFADKMGVVNEEKTTADEITSFLRAISFQRDPGYISLFLKNHIIPRYAGNLSTLLCQVYDGLMQRPPNEILSPSQVTSDEDTPLKSQKPRSSSKKAKSVEDPQSSDSSRTLVRRHSVMGIPAKRREIVIPKKGKYSKSQKKNAGKKSAKKSSATKKPVTPVKKVRRNLFVRSAEGEADKASPKKHSKTGGSSTSERGNLTRRHSVAAFTASVTVADTPVAKQVSERVFRRQQWARRRARTQTDVTVVAESPLKDDDVRPFPRRSPRQKAASFYSSRRQTKATTSDTTPATSDKTTSNSSTTLGEAITEDQSNLDEEETSSMPDNRSSRSLYRAKSMSMKPSFDSVASPRRKFTRSLSVSGVSSPRLAKEDSFTEVFLETGDESGETILSVAGQNIVPGGSVELSIAPNKPQFTSNKPSVKQNATECPSKSPNRSSSSPTPGCSTRSVSRRSNSSPSLSIASPPTPSQSRCLLVHHKSFPTTSPVLFRTPKTTPKSSPINFSPDQIYDISIPLTPVKSPFIKPRQADAAKNDKLGTSPFRNCDDMSPSVVPVLENVLRGLEDTVRDTDIAAADSKIVTRDLKGVVQDSDIVGADSESVVAASPQLNRKQSFVFRAKSFRSKTSLNFETSSSTKADSDVAANDVTANDVTNQQSEFFPVSNAEVQRTGAELDNVATEKTEVFKSPVARKRKRVAPTRTGNESPLNQILKQRKNNRNTPPGTPRSEKLDKKESSKNSSKRENKSKHTPTRKARKRNVNSEADDMSAEETDIAQADETSDDALSPDNNFTTSTGQQRNPKLTSPNSCNLQPQFTPRSLSADSLRHLQESPVLFGSSPQSSDTNARSLTRKWSERNSPFGATQHTLRKRFRPDS